MRYRIGRFREGKTIHEMENLSHEVCSGILELVWGIVPDNLANEELGVGQEMKLHLGGPDWLIVQRTA
jgi:hypothetical protein